MASMLGGAGGAGGASGGGMSLGQMGGSMGGGGGSGRDSGKGGPSDMSDWAFKYYHDYSNDPQGRPMQEGLGQMNALAQLAYQQPQKSPWEPVQANRQDKVNSFIQELLSRYHA